MNYLLKIAVVLTLFSSLLGPSVRWPYSLPSLNIYIPDVFTALVALLTVINFRKIFKLIKNDPTSILFLIFTLFSFLTLIITPVYLSLNERVVSMLYLIRYCAYFSLYPASLYLISQKKSESEILRKTLYLVGIGFIILGWLQYFLYPDLRNLSYIGWDPHYKRIFGLIFDPNYLGLIFVIFFLLRHTAKKMVIKELVFQLLILVTIGFTYSRSSYLALLISLLYFAKVSKKLLIYATFAVIFIFSLILLPRPGGIGVKLERLFSIEERILNWQNAAKLINKYPLSGVGFNTLRYVRINVVALPQNWLTSHSAAGVDNSYLFVAATTGLIGLSIFLYFLFILFKGISITGKTVLIAIFVHSLFLNSLFFPSILVWFWLIAALEKVKSFKENN